MGTDGRTSQNSAIQAYTTVDKRFFIFQIQKFELYSVSHETKLRKDDLYLVYKINIKNFVQIFSKFLTFIFYNFFLTKFKKSSEFFLCLLYLLFSCLYLQIQFLSSRSTHSNLLFRFSLTNEIKIFIV